MVSRKVMNEIRRQTPESTRSLRGKPKLGRETPLRLVQQGRRKGRGRSSGAESAAQSMLVQWLKACGLTPMASGNAQLLGPRRIGRAKREGLLPGAPDLVLLEPAKDGRHVVIEMKAAGGALSVDQRCVLERMARCGWHVVVAFGFDEAKRALEHLGFGRPGL